MHGRVARDVAEPHRDGGNERNAYDGHVERHRECQRSFDRGEFLLLNLFDPVELRWGHHGEREPLVSDRLDVDRTQCGSNGTSSGQDVLLRS